MLRQLLQETNATAIFAEEDYTPYARQRDALIAIQLPLNLIHGQTVHHPEFVKKAGGKPYTIYTPYSKVWKSLLQEIKLLPAPKNINTPAGIQSDPFPAFESNPLFPAGEAEALKRLKDFASKRIFAYDEARNRMDLDGTILALAIPAIWNAWAKTSCQCGETGFGGVQRRRDLVERTHLARVLYPDPLSLSACQSKCIQCFSGKYTLAK